MQHPFFAWAGLRPPIAQHTATEHQALEKYAGGCKSLVEIGVAEGASAVALRTTMNPEGTLYLVDPFHLSRVQALNFDGDHQESAVEQDWNDWNPHVVDNGVVGFHDARLFPGGWTSQGYGPVCFVDRAFRSNPLSQWMILDEVDSLVFVCRRKRIANADVRD